jgi:hypothetical protein
MDVQPHLFGWQLLQGPDQGMMMMMMMMML